MATLLGSLSTTWAAPLTFPVIDFPPYIIAPKSSDLMTGMDIEVVKAAFHEVGMDVRFEHSSWKKILQGMEQGLILGTVSCARTPERAPYMMFSDELSSSSRVLISQSDHPIVQVTGIQDLNHYRVIAVEQWEMEQQLSSLGIPHRTTPSIEGGFKALLSGTDELFYVPNYPALYQARKIGIQKSLKIIPVNSEPPVSQHLCFSKQYPDSREVLQKFNEGLQIIKRNGVFQAIRNRYL